MSAWLLGACMSGVVTLHGVMPQVLHAYPERHCIECDGYMAVVDCRAIGTAYRLFINGKTFLVETADCVTSAPPAVGDWPRKRGRLWLGDIDATLWDAADLPLAPFSAMLCPADVFSSRPFDWRMFQ